MSRRKEQPGTVDLPPDMVRLARALRSKVPPTFETLCDELDMSPRATRLLLSKAPAHGITVVVDHDRVQIASRYGTQSSRVHHLSLSPLRCEEVTVAVISDTHYGSKYCLRDAIRDFIGRAYEGGVRHVFYPGDVLEGEYRHAYGEKSHVGLTDQTQDAFEHLPRHPGLFYHAITGNHDETFAKSSGVDVGLWMESYFRKHGRHDLHFYGDRGAYLSFYGALVHLWHPLGGTGHTKSYKLQKMAASYPAGLKPHLLLAGHWHMFCHVEERDVHAVGCPTFQHGMSPFGRALGYVPAVGGLILRWRMSEAGTMRDFHLQRIKYSEHDMVQTTQEIG